MNDFQIKLAQNHEEIESAQRLRFEVFNVEMGKGLRSAHASGLDRDEYDPLCDHILIIDKKSKKTIGTYRLLLRSRIAPGGLFYSEAEFDLSNIKKLEGEIMEMGRSCVHKDYRSNAIVRLLWAKILEYVRDHHVRYITGCSSIYTMDRTEISKIYTLLKKNYFGPEEFRVYPRQEKAVVDISDHAQIEDQEEIFLKLPSLVRSYFKVGAFLCGAPVLDRDFGTIDFFMLLDIANISDIYLRRLHIKKPS